jgi:phosphate-selective porin OprO/OprP
VTIERCAVAVAVILGCLVVHAPARGQTDDPLPPPPAVADDWQGELEQLRARIGVLESDRSKQAENDRKKKEADAALPVVKWSGQLQADTYWFDQDADSKAAYGDIQNAEEFRRARIAMLGNYGAADYRMEVDFALAGRPTILDMWTGFRCLPYVGRVRIGNYFEPFSLERFTSNRNVTFMERANPDQAFAPARNLGVMANNEFDNGHCTWAIGYFRTNSNDFADDVGDNFENAVTGRSTRLAWYDESTGAEYLHLGLAYSFRGTDGERARFRSQPEARFGAATPNVPFFIDTGEIPSDHFQLIGFEAAWVHGPFMVQSEYMLTPVDRIDLPSVLLSGGYVAASWFLTGEHRPYHKGSGTFDRVIPHREFLRYQAPPCVEFGPGAWELACRLSHVDLNDDTVHGGHLTDFTVGLNWYMTRYSRITANWVHAFAESPGGIDSQTNIYAMRMGFEF